MGLDITEIEKLVEKLRSKYAENSKKNSSRWFDPAPFEQRFTMARKNKMNLEAFILAEITEFEKLKDKYNKKKKNRENSFSKKIDLIIEENTARIKKYPGIIFNPRAGLEISHCYGAMNEFSMFYFTVLRLLIKDTGLKNLLNKFEDKLEFLSMPAGRNLPKRIEDHLLILSRPGVKEIEVEKDKSEYLKESAFLLHEIQDFCEGLIESRNPEFESPLVFNRLFIEEARRKKTIELFSGSTGYGALLKVRTRASDIISDFRLNAFKRK